MPGNRYTTPERISIGADVQYMSPHSVSKKHHCPIPTIYKFKRRYGKGSPMKTGNSKGCPKKVSMAFKTKIERVVHANRRSPLKELKDKCGTFPPAMSPHTFRKQLTMVTLEGLGSDSWYH
ncbi:hypothetical protein CcaverHIS002_0702150 [Cutaneotrichosporon cavernicola]|nr:hypothetical protein CcaverHIS002_0702150 [Cutaneotrichosporon cavernicola]